MAARLGWRAFLGLLVLAPFAAAQDADARAEFDKDLGSVRRRFERRQWKRAREDLERLLEEHTGQPYALARRVDIADLMKQCRFREEHGVPDPKEMVKGRLVHYNLATGRLKVRYKSPVPPADFVRRSGLLIHRARFKGPHKIRIDAKVGVVVVCIDGENGFFARVGGTRAEIGKLRGRGHEVLDSGRVRRHGGEVEIRVHRTAIDLFSGNRRVARADKPADRWGYWAVFEREQGASLTVEGEAEPSWIQGLVDREDHERLQGFEKTYRASDHLPDWLLGRRARAAGDLPRPDRRRWPVDPTAAQRKRLHGIQEAVARGEPDTALADLEQAGFPPPLRAHVRATVLEELGRVEDALEECDRACAGAEAFVPAREQRARLLRRLGRVDEAVAAYRGLLRAYPGGAALHARAALFYVECGRPADARRALAGALERGLSSRELRRVNTLVTKALNGPPFGRRFEHESRHYRIVTDLDVATAKRAARLLERAYALYTETLDEVEDAGRRRFTVYLFGGHDGFLKYGHDIFGFLSPKAAGVYSLALKQLLIWNLPQREQMLRTIRHEGFHQYVDRLIEGPPPWFNEGLAEYYEAADLVRGELRTGRIVDGHVATLGKARPAPLPELLAMAPAAFMKKSTLHYAQSWAFIQFLRHTTPERADLFRRFWDAFRRYPSHATAMRHALAGRSLSTLDDEFRSWLREQ